MAEHSDADLGNHTVALRGPGGDRTGDLCVARAERSWTLVLTADVATQDEHKGRWLA